MTDFERVQCWDQSRVGQVINKEAIAVDLEDFLATHAPLGQISYARSGSGAVVSEADLLNELQERAQADRHVFSLIQGIPGTGKSHLIRWLYQRYSSLVQGQDEVLLIERAQNSLLGTLRQIIGKLDVGGESMRQQIEKLRGAAESLSDRALKDSILDNLRVATYERDEPTKGKIRRGIEGFLLDAAVREMMRAEGGPLERIAAFLTSGRRGLDGDRPEFAANDFAMSAGVLRDITNNGRQEARDLANALDLRDELREELAGYLNRLLDYAISRTVVLSASDLQQAFNDLRRELRRRGRGLALFIEDITAFTGLDLGLIDVLATQHTGEANREFCRLTSVVGITDSYYRARFPDNLRERVTHHLTLNTGPADRLEAGLLHSPAAAADLAARYLNAMRASRSDVLVWAEDGANIERLPNRCGQCRFREPCHAAFGSVNIGAGDGASVEVGLYPFNERLVWSAYQRLDTTTASRTPRSLLNNILLDVLQTHGLKVIAGAFPPPVKELIPAINERDLPTLRQPAQQPLITSQGGSDAARIQALVLFWGDGTIDARGEGVAKTIGSLPQTVFNAFAIRRIAGVARGADLPPPPGGDGPAVPPPPPPPTGTKYDTDIANWRTGSRLEQYEDLRKFLVRFIETSIDWTLHGVSAGIVDERITSGRFEIEGQAGRAAGDRIVLERNDELAYVLQALAEINAASGVVRPEVLGAHLVTLSSWLRKHETRIVDHVLRPTREQQSPMPLLELLTLDCALIEMLSDKLRADATTPVELLRIIIRSASVEVSDRPSTDQDWLAQVDRAKLTHSVAWTNLMRTIGGPRVRMCRAQLLKQLNQPQGRSSVIRFIDAATALDVLARMTKRDWALRTIPSIDERASATWKSAGEVYARFAERLEAIILEDKAHQRSLLDRLRQATGDASPDEVARAVDELLKDLQSYGHTHSLGGLPAKAPSMRSMLQYMLSTAEELGRGTTAIRLSAGTRYVQQAIDLTDYLEKLIELARRIGEQQRRQIDQLTGDERAWQPERHALDHYDEIIGLLREPDNATDPLEVQS